MIKLKNLKNRDVNYLSSVEKIYADHAATSPLSEVALRAMLPYLTDEYGNPSTLYSSARKPQEAVKEARKTVAELIGAREDEIYFTSCGTESDNWAIKGTALHFIRQVRMKIITDCIEHHAVLRSCSSLEKLGIETEYLPVDESGVVSPKALEKKLSERVFLVSIMMANNEIGTLEPIRELATLAHRCGALFHTDAVQAVGHVPVNVRELGVDMLSASAHKFNGPKGVGFLFIRRGTRLEPLLSGGAQERGFRAGTENVAGIVGLAAALKENCASLEQSRGYLCALSTHFIEKVREAGMACRLNGAEDRVPGNVSLSFKYSDGERILHRLDLMGIQVGTGSACNSHEKVLSHVIRAIGVPHEYAYGTVRFSFGKENTFEEIEKIVQALKKILGNS